MEDQMGEMLKRVAEAIAAAAPGDEARAAIEAMRAPTEGMLDAGGDVDPGWEDGNASAGSHWAAMIGAALTGRGPYTAVNEISAEEWMENRRKAIVSARDRSS